MPQAPIYKRKKNFTENSGNATDHTALNDEFDAVAQSINDLRKNQSSILTDEGKLLVDAWFLGMADIDREYNCIEFQ